VRASCCPGRSGLLCLPSLGVSLFLALGAVTPGNGIIVVVSAEFSAWSYHPYDLTVHSLRSISSLLPRPLSFFPAERSIF